MNAGERFSGSSQSSQSTSVREWFFVDTGDHTGDFNMKFDLGLVEEFRITRIPVLRLYGWKPYCVSLGRNQNESDIVLELAERDGIDVVRRPTGGKAVLHAEELTYSVVMETGGSSVRDSYSSISAALVEGLRRLGAEFELQESSADFQKLFRDPSTIPCFSTSAVYEVEYKGRKVVGSAQHRFGDVLLQHGSILIGEFHKRIVDYLNVGENVKEKTRKDLESHTATLNEILLRNTTRAEVAVAVKEGFAIAFGAGFADPLGTGFRRRMD